MPTLRDRLPSDLRSSAPALHPALPFKPLYLLEDEYAAEIANRTVHGVMHVGWVRVPMAATVARWQCCVKPNGFFGAAYMKAIAPFRHLIVYPAMIRQIEREWPTRRTELRNAG